MARLSLQSPGSVTATSRDRSSRRTESDSEPGEVSQQLSASLERIIHHAWEDSQDTTQGQVQGEDGQVSGDLPEMMNQDNQAELEDTELFRTGDLILSVKTEHIISTVLQIPAPIWSSPVLRLPRKFPSLNTMKTNRFAHER